MNTGNNLEIEVKFYIPQAETMRKLLLSFNPILKERCFEKNIRFDDNNFGLLRKGRLLRLREDNRVRLTFKAPAAVHSNQARIRQELEVELNDCETMRKIIHGLGFVREQIYEKYRETFLLNELEVCLDNMPFGDFLEIEGSSETMIAELAAKLGLNWEHRILNSYLSIFSLIQQRQALPFNDLTFANMQSIQIRMEDYLPQLYAGRR